MSMSMNVSLDKEAMKLWFELEELLERQLEEGNSAFFKKILRFAKIAKLLEKEQERERIRIRNEQLKKKEVHGISV